METNGHNEAVVRELIISNQSGLHARPAAAFVKMANKFQAEITVTKDGDSVNGKSIMGLMTLAAAKGTRPLSSPCIGGDTAASSSEEILRGTIRPSSLRRMPNVMRSGFAIAFQKASTFNP